MNLLVEFQSIFTKTFDLIQQNQITIDFFMHFYFKMHINGLWFRTWVTISSFLVVFLFLFLKKRGITVFLSWHFHAFLSLNYAKYCKIARIIDKIYKFFRIFYCTIQDLLIQSQKVTIIHESCKKNPEICNGMIMQNVPIASCAIVVKK